ncbi:hypothetical protein SCP_0308670 [Sparassis crispa]|uniref:Zinc-finger domain-containing protein n=1 Tax=Sparassis crispa TaxID=139825 RepID=A0A401GG93_9APHY|nr:hypothetical protein SCP_0308670 [Sparassis crispa]GBE81141.1 hypothetical protein SCP_0308670 [Sparassis crispa]
MATHSHKSKPVSFMRKRRQVYVDIPPSPLHSSTRSARLEHASESSLKENAPLQPTPLPSDSSLTSLSSINSRPNKRKLSDASRQISGREELIVSNSKKPRVVTQATPKSDNVHASIQDQGKAAQKVKVATLSLDYPDETDDELFYCHQCNKKRVVTHIIQCTAKKQPLKLHSQRCGAKYCRACLLNRYALELDDIKKAGEIGLSKNEKEKHVSGEGFYFQCPKCKDECNCRNCRKAQGLQPTGNLTLIARKAGKDSAAQMLADNPSAMGNLPGLGRQVVHEKKPRATKINAASSSSGKEKNTQLGKSRVKPLAQEVKRKPRTTKPKAPMARKPVPKPTWTRVSTTLTLTAAEMRMDIREFFLRFFPILDIAKGHLEDLEVISTSLGPPVTPVNDAEEEELVGWVSEPCAKALILSLLAAISGSSTCNDDFGKRIKAAMKEIRTAGASLNRIWSSLMSLRQALGLMFPDPLPPPASFTYHNTRSGLQGTNVEIVPYIAMSAQLVPVIAALLELALDASTVREELEQSATKEKDIGKDVKEGTAKEKTRWKDQRETLEATAKGNLIKTQREFHRQKLEGIEHAHRLALYTCTPRFSPLGQDHEGRVYYALTPGMAEREAALQVIAGKEGKIKVSRKRGVMTEDDRKGMQRWSWFVAVWGRLPRNAVKAGNDDNEDEDEDEGWWGFWEPEQVRRVASWIAEECRLGDDGFTTTSKASSSHLNDGEDHPRRAGSSNSSTNVNNLHDSRELSPLSDLDSDEDTLSDEDESDGESDDRMHSRSRSASKPNRKELGELVNRLQEYAVLLQWRIQRVEGEGTALKEKDNGVHASVPAKKFYG